MIFLKEKNQKKLHHIICSKKCDAFIHEEKGFSNLFFNLFTEENIFKELKDSIKKYINTTSSFF